MKNKKNLKTVMFRGFNNYNLIYLKVYFFGFSATISIGLSLAL